MSDSTSHLTLYTDGQQNAAATLNNTTDAAAPAMLWGRNAFTSAGLTWGYFGGVYVNTKINNGSITLSASATNYIVATKAAGTISVSTDTTNWNDTANYFRLYSVVTSATAQTSWQDWRDVYALGTGGGGGEANTGANIGASGEGLYAQKVGVELQFKKIVAGANITLTPAAETLTISSTGGGGTGGEANTASNVGTGEGLYKQKVGVNLEFKSLVAGTNVTLTPTADTVVINASGGSGSKEVNVVTYTANTTAVVTDANSYIRMNSASTNTYTLPNDTTVNFPIGTSITVRQIGTGATFIGVAGGVTLNNVGTTLQLRKQQSTVQVIKVAANTWDLFGDITGA